MNRHEAPKLPPGRRVDLGDRGQPYVREAPGPRPDDTTAVVLLHGWTVTADLNFFTSYDAVAAEYRLAAMDLRGHGRGIRPKGAFRLEDCADDVIALADATGIEKIIAVGYSMGGAVAQLVAHRHPERTAGVVLCATSGLFGSASKEASLWNNGMQAASGMLRAVPSPLRQQFLHRFLATRQETGTPAWMLEQVKRHDPAHVMRAGAVVGRFDSREWISDLGVAGATGIPAAVIAMKNDTTVPPSRQRRLAASIPGCYLQELDADHRAAVMAPNLFVPALRNALRYVREHERTSTSSSSRPAR